MLEEALEALELGHRGHQLLQVLEPPRRVGRLAGLPHVGVARFLEHGLDQLVQRHAARHRPPAREILHQAGEGAPRPGLELVGLDDPARDLGERDARGAREVVDGAHGRVADAPARGVDDALEGEAVVGLVDHPQIGDGVADLQALVETRAADHPVGDAEGDEALLELAGLEAGANQDGDRIEGLAVRLHALHLVGDDPRFLLAVPNPAHGDLLAIIAARPQGLAQAPLVARDEPGGGREDVLGRAVILLEPDHLGAGEVLLEAQDVAHLGPAPAVDGLVVVSHAADVARALGQEAQPQVLGHVGVLVFVHQDVAEAALVVAEDVRVACEQGQAMQQQVAEIAGVEGPQAFLVSGVELERTTRGELRHVVGAHLLGREPAVLPALNGAEEDAGGPALLVEVGGRDHLFQEADLVVRIQDGEVGLEAQERRVAAQDADREGVEGAEPQSLDHPPDEGAQALAHLARGLVGEGDGEDLAGPGAAQGEDMGEARDEHPGLARAGAREHQDRPVDSLDGRSLSRVQMVEIGRHARRGRGPRGGLALRLVGKVEDVGHAPKRYSTDRPGSRHHWHGV